MKNILLILLFVTYSFSYEKIQTQHFIKYQLKTNFDDVVFAVQDEMISDGFTLSYDSNIAVSANAMSKHLKENNLFLKARKLGFCKNTLGYNLIKENKDNIIYCPIGIAIYETTKDDITIIYQTAHALGIKKEATSLINTHIEAILETLLEEF